MSTHIHASVSLLDALGKSPERYRKRLLRILERANGDIEHVLQLVQAQVDEVPDPRPGQIILLVARHNGVSESSMLSGSKRSDLCKARYQAAGAIKELLDKPHGQIAMALKRDRTTALVALRSHRNYLKEDAKYAASYESLIQDLRSRLDIVGDTG